MRDIVSIRAIVAGYLNRLLDDIPAIVFLCREAVERDLLDRVENSNLFNGRLNVNLLVALK